MAEFQDVMKQFDRMCWYYQRKQECPMGCPMNGVNISQCRKMAFEEPIVTEKTVMAWAAEHPELVYPTWEEYFIVKGLLFPNWNKLGMPPYDMYKYSERALNNHIPADIAQKLGIEPKEV